MRPVVINNSTRTVDDLLIAFYLIHNLLLHFQRRQGNLKFRKLGL